MDHTPTWPSYMPRLPGYDDEEAGDMAIHYLCRGERFTSEGAPNWIAVMFGSRRNRIAPMVAIDK